MSVGLVICVSWVICCWLGHLCQLGHLYQLGHLCQFGYLCWLGHNFVPVGLFVPVGSFVSVMSFVSAGSLVSVWCQLGHFTRLYHLCWMGQLFVGPFSLVGKVVPVESLEPVGSIVSVRLLVLVALFVGGIIFVLADYKFGLLKSNRRTEFCSWHNNINDLFLHVIHRSHLKYTEENRLQQQVGKVYMLALHYCIFKFSTLWSYCMHNTIAWKNFPIFFSILLFCMYIILNQSY